MDVVSSSTTQLQRFFQKAEDPIPFHTKQHPHHFKTYSIQVSFKAAGPLSADTHQVFDEIPIWDTFAWNNLIQTHLSNGDAHRVLSTYQQMLLRGVRPDNHTLPRILTASRLSGTLSFGKQLHGQALRLGFSSDRYVISTLMEMYGRLDCADSAKSLFDTSPSNCINSISWTLLARLYIKEGKPSLALGLFYRLMDLGADILDSVGLATAIGACDRLNSLREGRKVHKIARICGLEFDVLVSNSLLKMYLNCGSLKDARAVFDKMPCRDAISWTEMAGGYVRKGGFNEGLKLFRQMTLDGIKPDSLSVSSVLPACARIAAHKHGKEIHGYLFRNGIELNLKLQNALMDMYVKSGFIEFASRIFAGMKDRDVISWTVMILGYSLHGQGELGVALFREMQNNSSLVGIDQMAYAAVLHACCSARLVEEGRFHFNCIRTPKVSHCALMVALLARAGLFDEARDFIEERQIERDAEVLQALLDGCRNSHSSKIGKRIIEQLCDLEPLHAENYVLLSNWYADNSKQDMVDRLKETIRDMGLRPKKAYSWIEFRNKVHVFGTGDVNHPRSERIYWELQCLMKQVEKEGYRLKSDFSLHDVDEERECIPIGHSEMLAISFGLISTQEGATIRVTKNLRVCRNCHDTAKVVSKIVDREIILKDPNCFHHFKDGICSCGDFWSTSFRTTLQASDKDVNQGSLEVFNLHSSVSNDD